MDMIDINSLDTVHLVVLGTVVFIVLMLLLVAYGKGIDVGRADVLEKTDQQLKQKNEEIYSLVDEVSVLSSYKSQYEDLKLDFDDLVEKHQILTTRYKNIEELYNSTSKSNDIGKLYFDWNQ